MTGIRTLFVKPARPDLRVRAEHGGVIGPEGGWHATSAYLSRRLKDGDLVEATPPRPKSKTSKKRAKE